MNNQRLEELSLVLEKELEIIDSAEKIEMLRSAYLGKKGHLVDLMVGLKSAAAEDRKELGLQINQFKDFVTTKILEKQKEISDFILEKENKAKSGFDVTASISEQLVPGNLHFYTKFAEEIENIFLSMGFELFDGPEVETEFYNFTALNIPENHPARDMYDTFWLNQPGNLLRTHTSTIQVRSMLEKGAPLAGIAIGKVFRHEAVDATHDSMFTQCEGMFIDKNIGMSHLLGVAKLFLQKFFGKEELEIRTRPGFFPFVTPGVEIDMRCVFCSDGCSVCKKSTWIEVFPGGLIHPFVLEAGGIDSKEYSGFAFGFGVDRLAMLRHKINDVRLFKSGDIRFTSQF
jgi:phenylalanyl-tRNA synthetase alpha chain